MAESPFWANFGWIFSVVVCMDLLLLFISKMDRLPPVSVGPFFTAFSPSFACNASDKSQSDLISSQPTCRRGVRLYADSIIFNKPNLFNRHRDGRFLRFSFVVSTMCDIPFGWAIAPSHCNTTLTRILASPKWLQVWGFFVSSKPVNAKAFNHSLANDDCKAIIAFNFERKKNTNHKKLSL